MLRFAHSGSHRAKFLTAALGGYRQDPHSMGWDQSERAEVGAMSSETIELDRMVAARHRLPEGFDSSPFYRGLPDDMCPCEHWCYLASGKLRYRFADGETLTAKAGDAFYVRAGHLAEVLEDAELIEFTPAEDYRLKAEHLARRVED
jgi:hypothetical protein